MNRVFIFIIVSFFTIFSTINASWDQDIEWTADCFNADCVDNLLDLNYTYESGVCPGVYVKLLIQYTNGICNGMPSRQIVLRAITWDPENSTCLINASDEAVFEEALERLMYWYLTQIMLTDLSGFAIGDQFEIKLYLPNCWKTEEWGRWENNGNDWVVSYRRVPCAQQLDIECCEIIYTFERFGPKYFNIVDVTTSSADEDEYECQYYNLDCHQVCSYHLEAPWGVHIAGIPVPKINVNEESLENLKSETFVAPNPATNSISIAYKSTNVGKVKIKIYNYLGVIISNDEMLKDNNVELNFNFDISNYSAGIYFYEIECNGTILKNKFIVTK